MRRSAPFVCAAFLGVTASAPAQDTPCQATNPIRTYRVDPIPNAFTSIAASAGAVMIAFSAVDDGNFTLPFGAFTFAHYGIAKATVHICTNGFVNFTAAATAFANKHPDDESTPNDAIFPWNDDLHLGAGSPPAGTGWYLFDLTPGLETLTIEWNNVITYPTTVVQVPFTFQLILFASSHGLRPNTFELHYDRATDPGYTVCGDVLTSMVSATIGNEPAASATGGPTFGGIEATDRGAANEDFPTCDLRFTPVVAALAAHSARVSVVRQEPFCSIVPIPGTVSVPNTCTAGQPCTDNDNSTMTMNAAIPIPWKFNLDGRIMSSANMFSNGYLGLGQGNFTTSGANAAIPGIAEIDAFLSPFWDDLEGGGPGSGMYYRVDGRPGCRFMTFEWARMDRKVGATGDCAGAGGNISFQVRLFEGSAGALAMSTPVCWYDLARPGDGNDRIEFHYDHLNFVAPPAATPFSASIGYENHIGAIGAALPGTPGIMVPPSDAAGLPGKVVIDGCDFGQTRFYGDRNHNAPAGTPFGCLPEIKTNAVYPIIGNPFALHLIGGTPGAVGVLMIDFGPPLPGMKAPVPCGGLPLPPLGTFWVNPAAAIFVACGPLRGSTLAGACDGCCFVDLPIPLNPLLIGLPIWFQWLDFYPAPFAPGIGLDLSEGAKVIIGG